MVIYNFLDPKLTPKVSTSSLNTDNYEVENLISPNYSIRSRGFLAYSVVKPPVDVTFELICSIHVQYILLTTSLNNQKYTVVEIFAKSGRGNYISIGHGRFKDIGIVFCNKQIYSADNPPPNFDQSFQLRYLKNNTAAFLENACFIKVRILKTEGSVPNLAKVEIWGKPSKSCSINTVNTIERLMLKPLTESVPCPITDTIQTRDGLEIPEDFKDAITYEVMSLPFTLPSGNTVDQSTLEKCTKNDASYCRQPSDPFTGQQFTQTRKPIFNSALKQRIDMFLLKNSHEKEIFNIKRTLGSNTTSSKRKNEVLTHQSKFLKISDSENGTTKYKTNDPDQILEEAIENTFKSKGFVCFTNENENVESDLSNCVRCKDKDNLYVIPCSHLFCKNCLIFICNNLKCSDCMKSFSKTDAKRFHITVIN